MDNFVDLFMVSPLLLVVLFFVAMLAGFIDALAGGGGLLTVPALLAAGMSPAQALATNKLQACGGSLSASLYFIRRKVVCLAEQKLNILMTFIGSTSGALLVQHVQSDILRQILPVLVICIGLYFLLMPKLGEEDRQTENHGQFRHECGVGSGYRPKYGDENDVEANIDQQANQADNE